MIDLKAIHRRVRQLEPLTSVVAGGVIGDLQSDIFALIAEVTRLRKALQQVQSCSDPEISDMIEKALHETQ